MPPKYPAQTPANGPASAKVAISGKGMSAKVAMPRLTAVSACLATAVGHGPVYARRSCSVSSGAARSGRWAYSAVTCRRGGNVMVLGPCSLPLAPFRVW